jgi:Molydopterin dinucleotide binding domain
MDRWPYPFLQMNPDDMAELKFNPGDLVEIYNDNGSTYPKLRHGESKRLCCLPIRRASKGMSYLQA